MNVGLRARPCESIISMLKHQFQISSAFFLLYNTFLFQENAIHLFDMRPTLRLLFLSNSQILFNIKLI
jgi:hypothetical protein